MKSPVWKSWNSCEGSCAGKSNGAEKQTWYSNAGRASSSGPEKVTVLVSPAVGAPLVIVMSKSNWSDAAAYSSHW